MAELYGIDTGLTALTAATAKTLIEGTPTTNGVIRVVGFEISSDYTTIATPISLKIELTTFAATGTGTVYTPKKLNGEAQNVAAVSTWKINDTVEPATQTVIVTRAMIIPGGPLPLQFPLGRESFYLAGVSSFMGYRVTASAGCNVGIHLQLEG